MNSTLDDLVRGNLLRHVEFGKTRLGRLSHRIVGSTGYAFRFVLDLDACAVVLPSFLRAPLPTRLLRDLSCLLRRGTLNATADSGIDAQRGELRVFVQHGAATLSVTVKNVAYEYCTRELLRLGDDILTNCLSQPAYHTYRARCFGTCVESGAVFASPP